MLRVQVAQLPDGSAFLCFARTVTGAASRWGEPPPVHVIAMGAPVSAPPTSPMPTASTSTARAARIGFFCRPYDRPDCRSRAFPPLEHRLPLDPHMARASPFRVDVRRTGFEVSTLYPQ